MCWASWERLGLQATYIQEDYACAELRPISIAYDSGVLHGLCASTELNQSRVDIYRQTWRKMLLVNMHKQPAVRKIMEDLKNQEPRKNRASFYVISV